MNLRRLQPSESRELRAWIIQRHYLNSAPPGYRLALEFLSDGQRIGAMLLGRPTSRELDPDVWMELTRMYFIDEAPKNTESAALARMRKFLRVWYPQTRGLIAYSDPSHGHLGTVYAADGWAPFGMTKAQKVGWSNRPNSKPAPPEGYTSKRRWVRTP